MLCTIVFVPIAGDLSTLLEMTIVYGAESCADEGFGYSYIKQPFSFPEYLCFATAS